MPGASDGRVPVYRPDVYVSPDIVKIGAPVLAQTALDHALLAHWISGRGQCVIPQHRVAMIVSGTTETLRYYVPGSGRAMYRAWVFDLRTAATNGEGPSYGAEGTITVGGVTVPFYTEHKSLPLMAFVLESGVTPSTSEGEVTIQVTSDTTRQYAVRIESVGCWELPRAVLDRTVADCGVSLDSLFPRRPIIDDDATPSIVSLGAVYNQSHRMTVAAPLRRIGHIARWGYEMTTTSTTGVALTTAPYRLLPRKTTPTSTTKTVRARVYAENGDFRVVAGAAGASAWTALPATYAWSNPIDVAINCESTSTVNGVPSGGYDTLSIEIRKPLVGISPAKIRGWCVYEND